MYVSTKYSMRKTDGSSSNPAFASQQPLESLGSAYIQCTDELGTVRLGWAVCLTRRAAAVEGLERRQHLARFSKDKKDWRRCSKARRRGCTDEPCWRPGGVLNYLKVHGRHCHATAYYICRAACGACRRLLKGGRTPSLRPPTFRFSASRHSCPSLFGLCAT